MEIHLRCGCFASGAFKPMRLRQDLQMYDASNDIHLVVLRVFDILLPSSRRTSPIQSQNFSPCASIPNERCCAKNIYDLLTTWKVCRKISDSRIARGASEPNLVRYFTEHTNVIAHGFPPIQSVLTFLRLQAARGLQNLRTYVTVITSSLQP